MLEGGRYLSSAARMPLPAATILAAFSTRRARFSTGMADMGVVGNWRKKEEKEKETSFTSLIFRK